MRQTKNFGKQDKMIPCPCCGKGQLSAGLHVVLEDIKKHFNGASVTINSACRCKKHHIEIYKKLNKNPPKNSDHLLDANNESIAADITVSGRTPVQVYEYLEECAYNNIIAIGLYKWGVHVGLRGVRGRWVGY